MARGPHSSQILNDPAGRNNSLEGRKWPAGLGLDNHALQQNNKTSGPCELKRLLFYIILKL